MTTIIKKMIILLIFYEFISYTHKILKQIIILLIFYEFISYTQTRLWCLFQP